MIHSHQNKTFRVFQGAFTLPNDIKYDEVTILCTNSTNTVNLKSSPGSIVNVVSDGNTTVYFSDRSTIIPATYSGRFLNVDGTWYHQTDKTDCGPCPPTPTPSVKPPIYITTSPNIQICPTSPPSQPVTGETQGERLAREEADKRRRDNERLACWVVSQGKKTGKNVVGWTGEYKPPCQNGGSPRIKPRKYPVHVR